MELKQRRELLDKQSEVSLNRTFMELKLLLFSFAVSFLACLNRTFMELKHHFGKGRYVPLWS